jgi:hypothetical protein
VSSLILFGTTAWLVNNGRKKSLFVIPTAVTIIMLIAIPTSVSYTDFGRDEDDR